MTKILLTGGSGFIASHILETLLMRGHSVVTTVRNIQKVASIKQALPQYGKDRLDFVIVEDVAKSDAFNEAVVSDPPFDTVIHTASPFHFNVTDIQKQLLDPAVIGTTGILQAIKEYAPTVKRVVITSSFGSMMNISKGGWPDHTYSEEDWNPITLEAALSHPGFGYSASKTFAEKAAWNFLEKEKPSFTLSTINPPLVFGPVVKYVQALDSLNTSSQIIRSFILGQAKEKIPDTGGYFWVDVRDVALAHVKAAEAPEAENKRFFVTAGHYNNRMIVDMIRQHFPEYSSQLPDELVEGGRFPEGGCAQYNNKRSVEILGLQYRSLEKCVVDTVKSFKSLE